MPGLVKTFEQYDTELRYFERRLESLEPELAFVRLTLEKLGDAATTFAARFGLTPLDLAAASWSTNIVIESPVTSESSAMWIPPFLSLTRFEQGVDIALSFNTRVSGLDPEKRDRSFSILNTYFLDNNRDSSLRTTYTSLMKESSYKRFSFNGYPKHDSSGRPARFKSLIQETNIDHQQRVIKSSGATHYRALLDDTAALNHIISKIDAIVVNPRFLCPISLAEKCHVNTVCDPKLAADELRQLILKTVSTTRCLVALWY